MSSLPATESMCPRCHAPLGAGNLSGRCPRCLAAALASPRSLDLARLESQSSAPPRVGPYEILDEVGRGGMGIVYRARHVELDREVALKVLRDSDLASLTDIDRFRNEAQAAARLAHPHIVRVHDVGDFEGRPYIAMEFIAGRHLAELTRDAPLAVRTSAELLAKIADAIGHAHDRGVLHRDLKPSNVIVDATGEPHVTDFGVAKRLGPSGVQPSPNDLTLSGQVVGTPAYMAPEQASGSRAALGPATDVYSLGALLYHLLTGRPPFLGDGVADILRQVAEAEPLSPRLVRPGLPRDLATICLRCLAKDPAHRYPTARDLSRDLQRLLRGEPIHARPASLPERLWRWSRRQPALAGTLVFAGLAVVVGFSATLAQWRKTRIQLWESQRLQARAQRLSREFVPGPSPLDLITGAAALRGSSELRHEAIANLAQLNLRPAPYRHVYSQGSEDLLRPPNFDISPRDGCLARRTPGTHGQSVIQLSWPGEAKTPVDLDFGGRAGNELRFGPDAATLAARYYEDQRVAVWDLATRRLLWTRQVPAAPNVDFTLDFSPDARLLAICSSHRQVRIFDVSDGHEHPPLQLPDTADPRRARFSPAGDLLAVAADTRLTVWDLASRRLRASATFEVTLFSAMDWHPDGRQLAVSCWNQPDIHLLRFTPADGTNPSDSVTPWAVQRRVWQEEGSPVQMLEFHPDGNLLMSRCMDGYTRLWDTVTERLLLLTHDGLANRFSADGRRLYFDRETEAIGAWDLSTNRVLHTLSLPGFRDFVSRVRFSPDGRSLAWIKGGDARLTDLASGDVRYFDLPTVHALSFDGNSGALNLATAAGLQTWYQGRLQTRLPDHSWVDFDQTPDGRTWIAVDDPVAWVQHHDSSPPRRHPLPRPPALADLKNLAYSVALSPDARWFAVGTHHDTGYVLDAETGRTVHELSGHRLAVVFDPRGRWLASGSPTEYCLWSTRDWRLLRRWPRQNPSATDSPLAVHPHGTSLAVSLSPRIVHLLDTGSGAELARLEPPAPLLVRDLAFDHDGRRLAVAGEKSIVRIWHLDTLRAELRAIGLDWR